MMEQARHSFWAFRQYLNPKIKKGWFQRDAAHNLQQYAIDLSAGLRPKLVIQAPPQHGKSRMIVEFIAWQAGHSPDLRTIYASFSERLGVRANLSLQRIFDSLRYQRLFPETSIVPLRGAPATMTETRSRELLEYVGRDGCFRNTTVRGSITGESLDLGVIDDPIKGREEAGSLTIRDKTWDWLLDDFFTRFSEEAGMLSILTRWHVDDPIGRLIATMPDVRVLSYKAIATEDEPYRRAGEPLFPEHKSLAFLEERRAAMARPNWEALYQQSPYTQGGEIIKGEWFRRYDVAPPLEYRVIFGDTAQKTAEHNDYSVFQCWGLGKEGGLYLLDQIRGKWEAPELKRRAIDFWNKHAQVADRSAGRLRAFEVEDKSSGTGLIQDIKRDGRIPIKGIPRDKDKLLRVNDATPYIEAGHVYLPVGPAWVLGLITECEEFTADDSHAHDDQIDPMCDAIEHMLARRRVGFFG